MALTYSSFESFDEVVAHYENIKPMGGSGNKGKDIRPIGDRKRKYERIVKISNNCYALSDGFHFGDKYFNWGWGYTASAEFVPTLKDMEKYAPIIWRKKRDGTEQVTIRNGYGNHAHNGRYAFINRHTPKGLGFVVDNGKQYVTKTMGRYPDHRHDERYYLAKTHTAPRIVYDHIKDQQNANWYQENAKKWVMLHDDNSALVFNKAESKDRFSGVDWVHVKGTGRALPKAPRVNIEIKAKYKDSIKKFFEWGMTMSPLMPLEDNEYLYKHNQDLVEAYGLERGNVWRKVDGMRGREIVRSSRHPARLAFWVEFAKQCYAPDEQSWSWNSAPLLTKIKTKEDIAHVRACFNRFINTELGFITKGEQL
jgi:hypothetical protein